VILNRSLITITRPGNVLITALAVIIGGLISTANWQFGIPLFCAAFSAALIAAGGNTFNDFCDRDLDRIQKAHRPIPSGKVLPMTALRLSAVCFIIGLFLSVLISGLALLIASWAVFLLIYYSWRWKREPLVGNIAVSFVSGLAFIYGGVAVGSIKAVLWAAGMAFFFHLGREIVKDMEDQAGDEQSNAYTFAVRFGLKAARYATSLALLLLILSLPLPYLYGQFNIYYLVIVLCGVLPALTYVIVSVWRFSGVGELHRLGVILKLDMVIGLAALLAGRYIG